VFLGKLFQAAMTRVEKKYFLMSVQADEMNSLYACPRVLWTGLSVKKSDLFMWSWKKYNLQSLY